MSKRISRMTQYTIILRGNKPFSVTEISTKISYHFHVDSSRLALNTHWLHHTVSDLAWSQISLCHLTNHDRSWLYSTNRSGTKQGVLTRPRVKQNPTKHLIGHGNFLNWVHFRKWLRITYALKMFNKRMQVSQQVTVNQFKLIFSLPGSFILFDVNHSVLNCFVHQCVHTGNEEVDSSQ